MLPPGVDDVGLLPVTLLIIHVLPGRSRIDVGLFRIQKRMARLDGRVAVLTMVAVGWSWQVVQGEMGQDAAGRHEVGNRRQDTSLATTARATENVDTPTRSSEDEGVG